MADNYLEKRNEEVFGSNSVRRTATPARASLDKLLLLKAVDLGLGGIIIRNFNRDALQAELGLELTPLAVLAIGKPAERISIVPAHKGDDLSYYRADGIHYVPKLTLEDILI